MASLTLASSRCEGSLTELNLTLVDFVDRVDSLRAPADVLDALHAVSTATLPLNVLGAARFPVQSGGIECVQLGKSAFLHRGAPEGWWDEYITLAKTRFTPAIFLARSSLASFTWTETIRRFEPIGVDRWAIELGMKHGMRDGLTYGVGGRWVVAFWSRKELSNILTHPARILICAAAGFAALRLEQLAGTDAGRIGFRARLTPREIAVLRMVSMGRKSAEIAGALGLGEETVRSHLKKAQIKLKVSNRTHAACEALRQNLIP